MGLSGARGRAGEALAAAYLELVGFQVRARNARVGGVEVDVMASEGDTQVLVEIKYRSRGDYGGGEGAIDASKRQRLLRAASVLETQGHAAVRIDVVVVERSGEGATVRHYRGAVTA